MNDWWRQARLAVRKVLPGAAVNRPRRAQPPTEDGPDWTRVIEWRATEVRIIIIDHAV